MAITAFKEITDRRGYKIDIADRKIFERTLNASLFGIGNTTLPGYGVTDMFEFILYDSNENQLPQGEQGNQSRYIYLDDANIRKYFRIDETIATNNENDSRGYEVDIETLIKEAGYSNGVFKTQITLLNRRMGSNGEKFDKVWIHEISPSRTEIRVLPVVSDVDNTVLDDLQSRYNLYTTDGNFRDDTIHFVQSYIETIDVNRVLQKFLVINGDIKSGVDYVQLIKTEFKIYEWDKFINNIQTTFIKSMMYFIENRTYDINSLQYSKPLSTPVSIDLSVDDIEDIALNVLIQTIDYILPKRNIRTENKLSIEDQITFDEITDVLKTTTDGSIYTSTIPESILEPVRGCTDPEALNFNPSATVNDGSCLYTLPPDIVVVPAEPDEVVDELQLHTDTFYIWSEVGTIKYVDENNAGQIINGAEYDEFTITYTGTVFRIGDIRDVPKPPAEESEVVTPDDKYPIDTNEDSDTINTVTDGGSDITIYGEGDYVVDADNLPSEL